MGDLFEVELDQEEKELLFLQNSEDLKQNSYLGLQLCRNLPSLNQLTCEDTEFNTVRRFFCSMRNIVKGCDGFGGTKRMGWGK